MEANGWNKSQAMTALTLGLRDQALTVLEALGKKVTYEQLLEALEARYGDAHLEHVFRAQLKDRVQRINENLQQWALEVEKLVRKAYRSVPALIEGNLVQTFIDSIRDLEVRAAVRLGHHETLKNALAHALEVEAVRQDHRSHRVREVAAATVRDRNKGYSPRCYGCGQKGHLRSSCPKRTVERRVDRSREGRAANGTAWRWQDRRSPSARVVAAVTVRDHNKGYSPRCYGCGERGHIRSSCPKHTLGREGRPSSSSEVVHVDRLARYYGADNARDEHVLGGGSVTRSNRQYTSAI
ncbi:unnamed protein product [Parnassius apollo]|uniref:(apollo) hypothetical protein n=1 Tax=Parnassius apollo TaxID=110799 RepID=A0A8S3XRR8_PARAO|nr:unnamed protein product [Parnassius apollo]